jgi:hypothetical protein
MRKNLVIVRAGDHSLHPQWLSTEVQRNWDLVISYFGGKEDPYAGQYEHLHQFKGSKWEGIADFCEKNETLIKQYDYIWLPDDDLLLTCQNINEFFDICAEHDLALSQPALLLSSYISYHITLQRYLCKLRRTNFVEIMAPCFNQSLFNLTKHTFSLTSSGWGLECLWKKIAKKNNLYRFAIVDQTPLLHTRPVSIGTNGGATESPENEMNWLLKKYDLKLERNKNLSYYPSHFYLTALFSTIQSPVIRIMYRLNQRKNTF